MADVTITIYRQDYNSGGTAQYNGWKANTISGALGGSGVAKSIVGYGAASSDKVYIPADFKDHKTVFQFNNTYAAAQSVTIHKGDSYQGVNDLTISVPVGLSMIWLESAPFVDQKTGKIRVSTTSTSSDDHDLTLVGYEMR